MAFGEEALLAYEERRPYPPKPATMEEDGDDVPPEVSMSGIHTPIGGKKPRRAVPRAPTLDTNNTATKNEHTGWEPTHPADLMRDFLIRIPASAALSPAPVSTLLSTPQTTAA